jgi:serine/threonine protein kinase
MKERVYCIGNMQAGYKVKRQDVLHLAIQIAGGMTAMHKHIVHCDLKPANILVNLVEGPSAPAGEHIQYINGIFKIADFGSACCNGDQSSRYTDGKLIGTLP